MTYSEYRAQFAATEDFRHAYGRLAEEGARALIEAEKTSTMAKACMITAWRRCREEVRKGEENGAG